MNRPTITVHLEISGIVQGVGYRESMGAVTRALDVRGWVRNRANGSVEAVVQGEEQDVERVIAWCHNGPPDARVRYVKTDLMNTHETFAAFTRRPSG